MNGKSVDIRPMIIVFFLSAISFFLGAQELMAQKDVTQITPEGNKLTVRYDSTGKVLSVKVVNNKQQQTTPTVKQRKSTKGFVSKDFRYFSKKTARKLLTEY